MKECVDSGSISECAMRQSVVALTKTLISSNDTVLLFLVLFGCFEFLTLEPITQSVIAVAVRSSAQRRGFCALRGRSAGTAAAPLR